MSDEINKILEVNPVEASAPCRIDIGGTLDINTFSYPLRHLNPCTFNIAIDLRTVVRLHPYEAEQVKITSKGFEDAVFPLDEIPFAHPLGLMFAIAAYYRAGGVHIDINSSSPPRSALGGSSAAAVALISAFAKALEIRGDRSYSMRRTAILAHAIEESVAGVPCGMQDQLAAAYGGVNAWYWSAGVEGDIFQKRMVIRKSSHKELEKHLIIAYCGIPHESKDINGRWIKAFLEGKNRREWREIVFFTQNFVEALAAGNYEDACEAMNRENDIRKGMTPDVLDDMGDKLVTSAKGNNCSARFTGAGGGGCIWGLGSAEDILRLKDAWKTILFERKGACLLGAGVDAEGLMCGIGKGTD